MPETGDRYTISISGIMVKGGASDAEILDANPEYFNQIDRMDKVRQTILQEQYRDKERTLETVYIFGKTGAGKTRHVLDKHGYKDLFCAFILQAIFKVRKAFFLQSVFYVFMVSARHLQQVQQIKEKFSPVCG